MCLNILQMRKHVLSVHSHIHIYNYLMIIKSIYIIKYQDIKLRGENPGGHAHHSSPGEVLVSQIGPAVRRTGHL